MASKVKKIVKWLLVGIPVVLIVVLLLVFLNLNRLIKGGIETAGPKVMQAPVTVEGVKLSPLSGNGEIVNLIVGNPEGFKSESAFKLGRIKLDIQLSSLKSDTIVINEMIIDAPEITYEMSSLKDSNIKRILANIEEFTGGPKEGEKPKPEVDKAGKKVVIKHFELNGATARIGMTTLGGRTVGATLPDIRMDGIGEKGEGTTGPEIIGDILGEVLKSLTKAASGAVDALKSGGAAVVGEAVGAGSEAAGAALKAGSEAAAKSAEQLKGATSDAVGGLKGLLGKDKDDK